MLKNRILVGGVALALSMALGCPALAQGAKVSSAVELARKAETLKPGQWVAAIPQAMEPGQGMIGGGVATWQGQQAFAIGISKSDSEGRFVVKAGATYNTRGKGGASAGVGFAF